MLQESPLLNRLIETQKEKLVPFHMPGHKNARMYKNLKKKLISLDTTEIPGLDNLHKAQGVIKEAQARAAETFASDESFFIVNGSTSGIYSMVMAISCPGDKLIVGRNCHQSVVHATILGDIEPVYFYPQMDREQGIALGTSPQEIEDKIKENPDAKGVLLTYPTYHGFASDLEQIAQIVHQADKILLVDEAHGAHLGLSDRLPKSALACGADIVVQSIHKTLPSLTQSSIIHVQGDRVDREKLKFMLRLNQSSSPSYILMASLDFATTVYRQEGRQLMERLIYHIDSFRRQVKDIEGVKVLGEERLGQKHIKAMDITKLWISMKDRGISGYQLEERLRKDFKIQMELSNIYGSLALTSIGNEGEDFNKLAKALDKISKEEAGEEILRMPPYSYSIPKRRYTPREALYMDKKRVKLEDSVGRVSGEYITPYPPGIPILLPGEIIEAETIDYVKTMVKQGMELTGLKDHTCQWIEII